MIFITFLRVDEGKNLFPGKAAVAGFDQSGHTHIGGDSETDGRGDELKTAVPGKLGGSAPVFPAVFGELNGKRKI